MQRTELLSITALVLLALPLQAQDTGGGRDTDLPSRTEELSDSLRHDLRQNSMEMVRTGQEESDLSDTRSMELLQKKTGEFSFAAASSCHLPAAK